VYATEIAKNTNVTRRNRKSVMIASEMPQHHAVTPSVAVSWGLRLNTYGVITPSR
jgi:hypothetical protein